MTDLVLNGLWAERFFIAGVLAAAFSVAAFAPYIYDTVRGKTQPDRACWLIWAVLASISGASHLSEGATGSLGFVGAQVLGTVIIFGLSIPFGSGRMLSTTNVIILGAAAAGLVSWVMTETAVYALALSILISALGGVRTIYKSYVAPQSETGGAWMVLLASAGFGVFSVGAWDVLLLAYPVYLLVLYAGIVMAGVMGRRAQDEAMEDAAWYARRAASPPPLRGPAIIARRTDPAHQDDRMVA